MVSCQGRSLPGVSCLASSRGPMSRIDLQRSAFACAMRLQPRLTPPMASCGNLPNAQNSPFFGRKSTLFPQFKGFDNPKSLQVRTNFVPDDQAKNDLWPPPSPWLNTLRMVVYSSMHVRALRSAPPCAWWCTGGVIPPSKKKRCPSFRAGSITFMQLRRGARGCGFR